MKHPTPRRTHAGHTLVEIMVACGMLAIASAAAIGSLIRMNHNAMLSRLQTGACTIAQERIDQILDEGPFNPRKGQIPPVLEQGTKTIGSESTPTIPIYADPANSDVVVYGWLTSTVTESTTVYGPWEIKPRHAEVTVAYKFRGRGYSVRLSTVRSPDA